MDDRTLLDAWRNGDASAGQALVSRHYEAVYRFFLGKADPQACEDLVQATFEVLCRRADDFRGDSTVRTFLFGIARHKLLRYYERKRIARDRSAGFDPAVEPLPTEGAERSIVSLFAARDREMLVVQALRTMPFDDQVLLELKDYEGLKARELAEILEIPPGTVASRLHRARKRLAEAVRRLEADPALVERTVTDLDGAMRAIRDRILAARAAEAGGG
ncbi:MAG: sigma-70 family RNA polymerase sigma factor [Deltaproteobacteria bacterium]|nr:MAG: sigma-70 family RNA polymerase sigma factor [Deltaproteobacteria bacterium]